MGIRNGRATYTQLREQYDKVHIRHTQIDGGTARTLCLLVSEGNVHIGVAKFSNRTFNFNKKKGRAIAQGRAQHAHDVLSGKSVRRESQEKRREELSYTITSTESNSVQDILDDFLGNNED
jgi:hypothetical protein